MSRDPIRNELRGLDSWITREPEWHQWDEDDQPGDDEPTFMMEPITWGWSTNTGQDEWGYPNLEAAKEGYRLDIDAKGAPRKPRSLDPRDPDHSRTGIFVYHNCSGCQSGAKPCLEGKIGGVGCSYPHARND